MLPRVIITPWRPGVCPPVHPATFLSLHCWRLAFRSLAGHGQASRGFGKGTWLATLSWSLNHALPSNLLNFRSN